MATAPEASPIPPRRSRTQAERSASTRGRLLDATVECLVEEGYAGTTTAEIESRAGTSRGARLHHFPTKAILVSAAVDQLYQRVGEDYSRALRAESGGGPDFSKGLRLLWKVHRAATHHAVLDLFLAARHDPELRGGLLEVSARQDRQMRHRANDLFPDLAIREADGLLSTLRATMLGLSMRQIVLGEEAQEEQVLALLERMVRQCFLSGEPDGESAPGPPTPEENDR